MKSPRAERIEPSTTNVHDREMAQPPSVATSKAAVHMGITDTSTSHHDTVLNP
jgi:hypothetical protein